MASRPRSPSRSTTSRTLLCGPKESATRRRWWLQLLEHHPVAVPPLRHALGLVAQAAQLEAPDPVDLDRRDAELGLGVPVLQGLEQRDAIDDQRAGQVDRVDPPTLARAVDAGRA